MNITNDSMPHRTLLAGLIAECEAEVPYYSGAQKFHYWAWHVAATLAFLTSIASAGVAAFADKDNFAGAVHGWLIGLPLVGAAATGCMRLYKFREREALREDGRLELQDIIRNARSLLAAAKTDADYQRAYHEVRTRFDNLERDQHRRDVALRDDEKVQPSSAHGHKP